MNIYDVAKEAGVSPSTVSRVLNNSASVRESTRSKVMAVIKKKEYTPSALARNLSTGRSNNIAFLVPDIENPFFSKALHGISDCAYNNGYNVFMFGTDENIDQEHTVLKNINMGLVCGIIIAPVQEKDAVTAEFLRDYVENGIPVILLDRDLFHIKLDAVLSNDVDGACEVVKCLIDEGHTKIGFIAGPETSRPGAKRLEGYLKALHESGISVADEYIANGMFREEGGYEAMKTLMELQDPPTAVFSSNNLSTLGCLKYVKEQNLKIGRDVSLVSFDRIRELECVNHGLTSVDRPIYQMGYTAMELVQKRLHDGEKFGTESYMPNRFTVDTFLVRHGSEKLCRD
ncbi:MAG: LacI family DNA-binding transcriptional regulator [Eubacterium sp.]|nr:LacI family DNA-binding transcriptional regulator [Eubacterium sp.]